MKNFLYVLATVFIALTTTSIAAKPPEMVIDTAALFTPEQAEFIALYHAELLKDHDIDYRVLTVESMEKTESIAYRRFKAMDVGSLSKSGRGLLLVVDPQSDTVRLEVSASLEGIYTDAFVSYIEHRQMIPFFQADRVADGILATTEMIFTRAQEAQAGKEFSPPMDSFSAGGGVSNKAQIGAGVDTTFRQGPDVAPSAGEGPSQVVAAYLSAMEQRNGSPELSIYSEDTKSMMRKWVVTPAQMDNVAKTFAKCRAEAAKVQGDRAVVRYPVEERPCSPYFLVLENGAWKLDLTMMQKAIRFNHRNEWHFDPNYAPGSEPYGFAFSGWRFDRYGFPHE